MKAVTCFIVGIIMVNMATSKSLDDIVKRHMAAINYEAMNQVKTMVQNVSTYQEGNETNTVMMFKMPDKSRVVTSFGGMDIITIRDKERSYTFMDQGDNNLVPLPVSSDASTDDTHLFISQIPELHKDGYLSLEGESLVKGKPVYHLQANIPGKPKIDYFIDKSTLLTVKTATTISPQIGISAYTETFITAYTEHEGMMFPETIRMVVDGEQVVVMTLTDIEINIPLDDSLFSMER